MIETNFWRHGLLCEFCKWLRDLRAELRQETLGQDTTILQQNASLFQHLHNDRMHFFVKWRQQAELCEQALVWRARRVSTH